MKTELIPQKAVSSKILLIRNMPVMLDRDLAIAYGVPTRRLNEQVKRNPKRFPPDAKFKLTKAEQNDLVANCDRFKTLKHSTSQASAFTELGVAMLSSVLNSEQAIRVNLKIMREFIEFKRGFRIIPKEVPATYQKLVNRIKELENTTEGHDKDIEEIFLLIDELQAKQDTIKPQEKDLLDDYLAKRQKT